MSSMAHNFGVRRPLQPKWSAREIMKSTRRSYAEFLPIVPVVHLQGHPEPWCLAKKCSERPPAFSEPFILQKFVGWSSLFSPIGTHNQRSEQSYGHSWSLANKTTPLSGHSALSVWMNTKRFIPGSLHGSKDRALSVRALDFQQSKYISLVRFRLTIGTLMALIWS